MTSIAFFVVAPEAQIKSGVFFQKLDKVSIGAAVRARAEAFSPELSGWVDEWFFPTLGAISIETLSWESLINPIESNNPEVFRSLQTFYEQCLIYNGPGI